MDLQGARLYVVALLIECPYEPDPADCCLHGMRKKSIAENIDLSKRLNEEELQHIIVTHRKCLLQKEGENAGNRK